MTSFFRIRLSLTAEANKKGQTAPKSIVFSVDVKSTTFRSLKAFAIASFHHPDTTQDGADALLAKKKLDVSLTIGNNHSPILPPYEDSTLVSADNRLKTMDSITVSIFDPSKKTKTKPQPKKRPSLSSPVSAPAPAPKKAKQPPKIPKTKEQKQMDKLSGFSLSSGSAVKAIKPPPAKKPKPLKGLSLGSNSDDLATNLLSSTSSGGGNVNKFLRKAMRGAVGKNYEATLANCRVAAVLSTKRNNYSFIENENVQTSAGGMVSFTVKYDKGSEGRGMFEDQVEIMGRTTLTAVISQIYNEGEEEGKLSLRPNSMAQLSPRVFWSLVKLHPDVPGGIEAALETFLPDFDWKFLYSRSKSLSEKALENKRQEMGVGAEVNGDGLEAIEGIEEAMAKAVEGEGAGGGVMVSIEEMRKKAGEAALLRLTGNENGNGNGNGQGNKMAEGCSISWKVTTPDEEDGDELLECVGAGNPDELLAKFKTVQIRNLRELANASPTTVASALNIDDEGARSVVVAAQEMALDELMLEILDGDNDALDTLRLVRSGTVQDLCSWAGVEFLLVGEVNKLEDRGEAITGFGLVEADVIRWCSRAKMCVNAEELSWLEMWVTPVLRV